MIDLNHRFKPDEPLNGIPAEILNRWQDAADWVARVRAMDRKQSVDTQEGELLIKNVSGGGLDQFAIVGRGAKLVAPTGQQTSFFGDSCFESATPTDDAPFAILQIPAREDWLAPAKMDGRSYCRINLASTTHEWAAPVDGVYTSLLSQSTAGPAEILWADIPTATQLDGAINSSVTTITVDSMAGFPASPFVIRIDSEDLNVTAILGETQLDGAITANATSIVVDSSADFPATPFVARIGGEKINVTSVVSQTWTVTRGYQSTGQRAHADNSPVIAVSPIKLTVTRGHNSTSAASHLDNAAVSFRSGIVWGEIRFCCTSGGGSGNIEISTDPSTETASGSTFTLKVGTSGTDFAVVAESSDDSVTWNLPDASLTARGLITTGTQSFNGEKTFDDFTTWNNSGAPNYKTFVSPSSPFFVHQHLGSPAYGLSMGFIVNRFFIEFGIDSVPNVGSLHLYPGGGMELYSGVSLVWSATQTQGLAKGGTGASLSDPGADKILAWDDTDNSVGFWSVGSGLSYDHATHTLSAGTVDLTSGVTGVLPLANGGTGANLSDPGADKLWGWDDTDDAIRFWTIGAGLSYDHATHTLSASSAGGITSLNGLTGSTQTFSDTDDTNVTLTISSTSNDHNFALGWTGQLGISRGGTGADLSGTTGIGGVVWQPVSGGTALPFIVTVAPNSSIYYFDGTGNWSQMTSDTVIYTPTTSGDWNGSPPSSVEEGLDRCAALLKALNGGTGP